MKQSLKWILPFLLIPASCFGAGIVSGTISANPTGSGSGTNGITVAQAAKLALAVTNNQTGVTLSGNGAGWTNVQLSGIAGQPGVGYFYDANNNMIRTNNSRDITILQKPSGAILYSNGVNAGVVSGASSVQIVVGFPNDPQVFGTNAGFVISGLANYTNGWSGGFALETTNRNGSDITATISTFSSVTTNGVDCPTGIVTIPTGKVLDLSGSVGNGTEAGQLFTNYYGFVKKAF